MSAVRQLPVKGQVERVVRAPRLSVAPADTLAFEDSMTGLRSARAAGARVVGVPTLRASAGERRRVR
jgi:beta-phosphoglucomutase-like phosphatase (HAD superfamily)